MVENYCPWIEKYKPNDLSSFKKTNDLLLNYNADNFNHCILYGNAGVGKTTFINILVKNIYKKEDIKRNVIFLNASDERGIDTVRYKIKSFAKQSIYKNYKYKIIILDEADSLTYEAQTALRRIIELYSKTTRFCFICNYENKIIEPIKSRCNLIKFNNFSNEYIKEFLIKIVDSEKIDKYYKKYIDLIIELSKNDLRKSIIYLETLTKLNKKFLNKKLLFDLFGKLDKKILLRKLKKIKKIDDIFKHIDLFNIYSLNDLLPVFLDIILELDIIEEKKYDMIILLSDIDNIKNKNVDYDLMLIKLLNNYIKLIN